MDIRWHMENHGHKVAYRESWTMSKKIDISTVGYWDSFHIASFMSRSINSINVKNQYFYLRMGENWSVVDFHPPASTNTDSYLLINQLLEQVSIEKTEIINSPFENQYLCLLLDENTSFASATAGNIYHFWKYILSFSSSNWKSGCVEKTAQLNGWFTPVDNTPRPWIRIAIFFWLIFVWE